MSKSVKGVGDGGLNLGPDKEINRDIWLKDVFPEWGTILNKEIEETKPEPNTFVLWWLGGAAWWMKSAAGANICIDQYSGSGGSVEYNELSKYSGVIRMTGAQKMYWLRCIPHVLDIWAVKECDAFLSTHIHTDHADFYTIKPLLQNTNCKFIGPPRVGEIYERWKVPKDRIITVKPGDMVKIKDVEIHAVESFDRTVLITEQADLRKLTMEDFAKLMDQKAVNYVLKTPYGTVYDAGDSHYSNMFFKHGRQFDIDIALITFGDNPDGMTDKMNPYDAYRAAKCLRAKVCIPMHYENWGIVEGDPTDLEMIANKKFAPFKVCIMRPGTKYVWPKDKDKPRIYYSHQVDASNYFRPDLVDLPFPAYL
ncbi:MAG: L-ascorbate 6-phosphate lactonase [Candidatus Bathyarchaeia archaeon]|nr:L-ascorbate 6-phosphate lactonase [Candidatus Bathyarchaeota archaeon]